MRLNVVWNMFTARAAWSMDGFYLILCRSISRVFGTYQLETLLVVCSVRILKNVISVMRRLFGLSMDEPGLSKFVDHNVSFHLLSETFLMCTCRYSSLFHGLLWSHEQRILHMIMMPERSTSLITHTYYSTSFQTTTSTKKVACRFFVSRR